MSKARRRTSRPTRTWWAVLVVGARCNPTNRWLAEDAAITKHDAVGIVPKKTVKSGAHPARVALWRSRAGALAEIRAGDGAYGRADGAEVIRKWKGQIKHHKGDKSNG
jgi:hypothetical protein